MAEDIARRKLRHIDACLTEDVSYTTKTAGFETVPWPYVALPELDLADVDLSTSFLGKPLAAPLLIGAMTGGAEKAAVINRHLALAAQHLGLGMMLGSQRVMLEHDAARASFEVRDVAPDVLLVGNLGAAQLLKGYDESHVIRAIELVRADALALHVNPLQEALQHGGDTNWRGITARMAQVIPRVPYPVMLKEVGHGISGAVARSVEHVGFAALDVAGAGGTSWAKVEQVVRYGHVLSPDLTEVGLPTATALRDVSAALPGMPLVASGGVRSGLDVAKSLVLGANVAAIARPLLGPALRGPEAVVELLERVLRELKVALFVAGLRSVRSVTAPAVMRNNEDA